MYVTASRGLNHPCRMKRKESHISMTACVGEDNADAGKGAGTAPDVKAEAGLSLACRLDLLSGCSKASSEASCCSAALNNRPSASFDEATTVRMTSLSMFASEARSPTCGRGAPLARWAAPPFLFRSNPSELWRRFPGPRGSFCVLLRFLSLALEHPSAPSTEPRCVSSGPAWLSEACDAS
jgi:hypothetical protein